MSRQEVRRSQEGYAMALTRWNPFGTVERWDTSRGLGDIQSEMNRLFDNFAGRQPAMAAGERMWWPAVDVHETPDDVVLRFEIPGVNEKDIHLSITGDVLTVRGERQFDRNETTETYHRIERAYGKFERSVQLSMPVQTDKVSASYREGVLEVKLPKAEELKPREIKIDAL
jgi:HSP20 family protein